MSSVGENVFFLEDAKRKILSASMHMLITKF